MSRDKRYEWENMEWTRQARDLLRGLNKLPEDSKIGIILRHSHRYKIKSAEKSSYMNLTPEGIRFAKSFGKSLPAGRSVNIYHSIVERCKETADAIDSGLNKKNGESSVRGLLNSLYDLNADGTFVAKEMMEHTGMGFLIKWKSGYYPPNKIIPFKSYCQNAAEEIWSLIMKAKKNSLFIFITHDLHLTSLKWGWFDMALDKRWVSYLGGFAFALEEDGILFLERDQINHIEYPHWWINPNKKIKN